MYTFCLQNHDNVNLVAIALSSESLKLTYLSKIREQSANQSIQSHSSTSITERRSVIEMPKRIFDNRTF